MSMCELCSNFMLLQGCMHYVICPKQIALNFIQIIASSWEMANGFLNNVTSNRELLCCYEKLNK